MLDMRRRRWRQWTRVLSSPVQQLQKAIHAARNALVMGLSGLRSCTSSKISSFLLVLHAPDTSWLTRPRAPTPPHRIQRREDLADRSDTRTDRAAQHKYQRIALEDIIVCSDGGTNVSTGKRFAIPSGRSAGLVLMPYALVFTGFLVMMSYSCNPVRHIPVFAIIVSCAVISMRGPLQLGTLGVEHGAELDINGPP
ncbi:hypothetical protein HYPSUDRAFT_209443 [Hypholoma sublateritium FD-334 SS-4]|uniref:Uncharacterized protein n=1 Tax=Hypholoma sublateritium (strain FD-334 SS-4) TaxID=945553 RepID=A0A0D2NYL8_HYPSF|nr:hypothetical protein HYPSUDRAFT_209443 [Hypholoma sublateritium FD-334 SS-4]